MQTTFGNAFPVTVLKQERGEELGGGEGSILLAGELLVHRTPSLGPPVHARGSARGPALYPLGVRVPVQVLKGAQLKQGGRGGRAMAAQPHGSCCPSAAAGPLPLRGPSARNPRHPGRGRGGFFVPLLGTSSTWSCRLHSQKFFSYFLIKSRAKSKPSLPLTHLPPAPVSKTIREISSKS